MVRGRRDAQGLSQRHSGLYDRRIVAYVISERNDSPLFFMTFDKAVKASPDACPPFRSDRGLRYANRALRQKLEKSGMTQSMSRVARCIDNGPMEGFWGILNASAAMAGGLPQEPIRMIEGYIRCYSTRRVQRGLGVLMPMEKHELYLAA